MFNHRSLNTYRIRWIEEGLSKILASILKTVKVMSKRLAKLEERDQRLQLQIDELRQICYDNERATSYQQQFHYPQSNSED